MSDLIRTLIRWDKNGGDGGGDPPKDKKPDPAPGSGSPTFTQEDVDRIIGTAKAKAKATGGTDAVAALLLSLEVKDADELGARLKTLADLQSADQTDLETAKGLVATHEATIGERDGIITTHEATIAGLTLQIAFNGEAAKMEINWATPQAMIDAFGYLEDVKIEEGKVVGLEEAIKKLQTDRAYLFNTGTNSPGSPLPAPRGSGKPLDKFDEDAKRFVARRVKA